MIGWSFVIPLITLRRARWVRFDVRVFAIRRKPGRRVFEVRWRVAGGDKSLSFITRALADSYRAELIRAARQGLEFDPEHRRAGRHRGGQSLAPLVRVRR